MVDSIKETNMSATNAVVMLTDLEPILLTTPASGECLLPV